MATNKQQPTAEQLRAMQQARNSQFMALTYEQPILANAENGTTYAQGKTLTYSSPIIAGGMACKVVLKYDLNVHWDGVGSVAINAGGLEQLVQNVTVSFGNKQISMPPVLQRVFDNMEGYARTNQDDVLGFRSTGVESLVHSVPTTIASGDNAVKMSVPIPLNNLHGASINGLIPIYSSGVRLQVALQLPNSVTGQDPIENVLHVQGGGAVTVTGDVKVQIVYRDFNSMSTTEALTADLTGLPTVQIVQLPSVTGITQGAVNYVSFRNPYQFAKLVHFVIDGKQSDKFATESNITQFSYDKAENSNSNFFNYSDATGGMGSYFEEVRRRFGRDQKPGVLEWDATTQNLANVSSKLGTAYLNMTGNGYPAMRAGFRVESVDNTNISSRILSFGVLLNPEGIKAL